MGNVQPATEVVDPLREPNIGSAYAPRNAMTRTDAYVAAAMKYPMSSSRRHPSSRSTYVAIRAGTNQGRVGCVPGAEGDDHHGYECDEQIQGLRRKGRSFQSRELINTTAEKRQIVKTKS